MDGLFLTKGNKIQNKPNQSIFKRKGTVWLNHLLQINPDRSWSNLLDFIFLSKFIGKCDKFEANELGPIFLIYFLKMSLKSYYKLPLSLDKKWDFK